MACFIHAIIPDQYTSADCEVIAIVLLSRVCMLPTCPLPYPPIYAAMQISYISIQDMILGPYGNSYSSITTMSRLPIHAKTSPLWRQFGSRWVECLID
jgi:hypothetical protein